MSGLACVTYHIFPLYLRELSLAPDESVDLVDEDALRLGHCALDVLDLVVHQLVYGFHLVEHHICLLVQHVQLSFVVLELLLLLEDLRSRVAAREPECCHAPFVQGLLDRVHGVGPLVVCADFAVGVAFIDVVDRLEALLAAWLPELFDVPGERLGKHLGVEAGELLENLLEHELLGQSESFHCRKGNV